MKSHLKFILFLMIVGMGCTPNGPEFIDELDLVATIDNSSDFTKYSDYVLADTIVFISDDEDRELDNEQEAFILNEIDQHFQSYGWKKAENPEEQGSDVAILVSVLDKSSFSIGSGWWDWWYWWPGWGWYPPYPPGGWYPGYPGYCCYSSIYDYREGTLIIEMVNPNEGQIDSDPGADPIPLLWSGALNGLLEKSQSNMESRVTRGLNRMFDDSPYLKLNVQ